LWLDIEEVIIKIAKPSVQECNTSNTKTMEAEAHEADNRAKTCVKTFCYDFSSSNDESSNGGGEISLEVVIGAEVSLFQNDKGCPMCLPDGAYSNLLEW